MVNALLDKLTEVLASESFINSIPLFSQAAT